MDREDAIDEIELLGGSTTRIRLLSALSASEAAEKAKLRERFEVSRTTLIRNLDELIERGWVREDPGSEYRLTASGQMVKESLEEMIETVDLALDLQPFLECVDPSEFNLDPAMLADADVTVASSADPYAPANRQIEALRGASEFRGCLSSVSRDLLEEIRQRAPEVEGTWELVVSEEAFEVLRSRSSYSELLEDIRENGGLDLYVYGGELPFSVWLYDDLVQVGIEDEEGIPRAIVEGNTGVLREWGHEVYERRRQEGVDLEKFIA